MLAARTIFSALRPGSLAIRFRVLVRATLARTVTRAELPCAARALSRVASALPTKTAGSL